MKLSILACVSSLSCLALAQDALPGIRATAVLADHSTIKGTLVSGNLAGKALFSDNLDIDPAIVRKIAFPPDGRNALIEFTNGDRLTVDVSNETFAIKSVIGELSIPRKTVRTLQFSSANAKESDERLTFYCTFDSSDAIEHPCVGPAGKVGHCTFTKGKFDSAARVPVGGSAGCFTLPAGTIKPEGCIEFWIKIESRKDYFRDCDPRVVFMRSPVGDFTVEFSSNNGSGLGGFNVRCFGRNYYKGGTFGQRYNYRDVLKGDPFGWHHYAISWTRENVRTFIDGAELQMVQYEGFDFNPRNFIEATTTAGFPNQNQNAQNTEPNTPFLIDEFKIWNFAKTEFCLDD